MTENKMQPHLHLARVHRSCLLSGNPDRVPRIAKELNDSQKIADFRGLVAYNGNTPNENIPVSVLTTGMGCPSTAIILEEAYRAGGRVFIRVGSCGALKPGMVIGDIVIPYAAIRDERTSKSLAPLVFPAVSSPEVYQKLCVSAEELSINHFTGIVWTTDIYYSTDQDEYKTWARCGANSVEMESSLLFVFGSVKNVITGSILTVDGNLAEGTQKDEGAIGDTDESFDKGVERAIACAIRAIELF